MTEETQPVSIKNPYPGPRPFKTEEAILFQGREKESTDLRDLVLSYQAVVFYSKSGSGKSSLVNAALIPALKEEGFEVLQVARVGGKVPPNIDGASIANIFSFNLLSSCLGSVKDSSIPVDAKLSSYCPGSSGKSRLLIIDQFEELFTAFPERWRDRKPFFEELAQLCKADKDLHVLLVIREDHLAELDPYADLLPYGLRIRYRLERLGEQATLKAITVPMGLAGYSFEKNVAEDLAANLRRIHVETDSGVQEVIGEYVEPMHLQLVCRNLWSNLPKEQRIVTATEVKKFADVDEALKSFYSQAVGLAARQTRCKEGRIRNWVEKKLITPGGTRGLIYMGRSETDGLPNEAVGILECEHLVRAEVRSGTRWYELTHDRLLTPVKASNRAWFARHRRWNRVAAGIAMCALLAVVVAATLQYAKKRAARLRAEQDDQAFSLLLEGRRASDDKNWDLALKKFNSALSLYTRLGVRDRQADIYNLIGDVYEKEYLAPEAIASYKQALSLHESLGDREAAADDRVRIAKEMFSNDHQQALQYYEQAAEEYDKLKIPKKKANAIRDAGATYLWFGDYSKAKDYLQRSLDLYDKLDEKSDEKLESRNPLDEAVAKQWLANVYIAIGQYTKATLISKQVIATFRDYNWINDEAWAILDLGASQFYQGNLTDALYSYQQGLALFERIDSKPGMAEVWIRMSQWHEARHNCEESIKYADRVFQQGVELHSEVLAMRSKRLKARAHLCAHDLQAAASEASDALNASASRNEQWDEAFNLDTLALIAEARGDLQDAIRCGQEAVEIYDSMRSQTIYANQARSNLARWKSRVKGGGSKATKE